MIDLTGIANITGFTLALGRKGQFVTRHTVCGNDPEVYSTNWKLIRRYRTRFDLTDTCLSLLC